MNASMQYRRKPVVIEAFQLNQGCEFPAWLTQAIVTSKVHGTGEGLAIMTLEGTMKASLGDWIIQGVKGEIYPCKPEIFAETYEAVPQAAPR